MFSIPSAPPGLDMAFDSILDCPITLSPDRMALGHRRNASTGSVYSDDSDDTINISDLDDDDCDIEGQTIGFPLQRMVQYETLSSGSSQGDGEENQSEDDDDDRLAALYRACTAARLESNHDAEDAGSDSSDTSSVAWDDVDFEQLVDSLLETEKLASNCEEEFVQLHPSSYHALSAPLAMHTLRLTGNPNRDDSSILLLFLALNAPELRSDPWNPVPRILRAVERNLSSKESSVGASAGSTVYLFHPPLVHLTQESNMDPDKQEEEQGTVAQWIDFFRQVLEGLAFLHENGVVWGGFDAIEPLHCCTAEPSRPPGLGSGAAKELEMFMMDISSDPEAFASGTHTNWTFDRNRYPVKYYFTNFRRARQISPPIIVTPAPSPSSPFTKEVQSCGKWFEALIEGIYSLRGPLLPLTQAMNSGTFTADAARKLFEARIRSLNLSTDMSLWDDKITSVRWRPASQPSEFCVKELRGGKSDVQRLKTLHVTCAAGLRPSRPGLGASRTRVTETNVSTFSSTALPSPGSITRSKSHPISVVPQENIRKDVFGDLSFAKSSGVANNVTSTLSEESISVRFTKSNDSVSEGDPRTSPGPSSPFNLLSPGANSHRTKIPPSPVFTIPSLVTFSSPAPLGSLPELSSPQLEQSQQQNPLLQTPTRRKTFALGTGIFSRKSIHYGPSLGLLGASNSVAGHVEEEREIGSSSIDAVVSSRPSSLMKISRSFSMPSTGSGT
ncbi:hypothetical protein F5890DRAFT_1489372 [Lentinula detonsa]|uniref:Uncharacterized protein n=1 Tax=Lentinula detonsa TaxID=2804962 RepID=A0AA38UW61_9AGAR|nr:hypothetical protein F5890DRAFT_1489372 [Lentinula detonsa]